MRPGLCGMAQLGVCAFGGDIVLLCQFFIFRLPGRALAATGELLRCRRFEGPKCTALKSVRLTLNWSITFTTWRNSSQANLFNLSVFRMLCRYRPCRSIS